MIDPIYEAGGRLYDVTWIPDIEKSGSEIHAADEGYEVATITLMNEAA